MQLRGFSRLSALYCVAHFSCCLFYVFAGRASWTCGSWYLSTRCCCQRPLRSHAAILPSMSLQISTTWHRATRTKCCAARNSSSVIWGRWTQSQEIDLFTNVAAGSICIASFLFVIFYTQVRSTETANGCREDVDTALLKLYAEQDHDSLLDLLASDNACLLADSVPWLEKYNKSVYCQFWVQPLLRMYWSS